MKAVRLLFPFVLLLGCDGPESPRLEYDLVETRRFGDADLAPDVSSEVIRHFGGGVLADVAGIVADSTGVLAVLDRDWAKIVRFDSSGRFLEPGPRGSGEGPGEFMVPIHLTRGTRGQLSALDYELGRVTWFTEDADPVVINLGRGGFFEHQVLGDTILLTRPYADASQRAFVAYFSAAGDSIGASPLLSDEDRPFGSPRSITLGPNGVVLVSTPRPGIWMEYAEGQWIRRGQALFPSLAPPREDTMSATEIRLIPAQATAAGIAVTSDGLVVQGYLRLPRPFSFDDPPSQAEHERYLAFFEPNGLHLGSVRLQSGVHSVCLTAHPSSGSIYLCSTDPFPQVIEYEVRSSERDSNWESDA